MKKIIIYLGVLIALCFVPVKGADIGLLKPVEIVQIYREGSQVVVKTDTEDVGRGNDGYLALENLKATTAGTIYLDTARYLLIADNAEDIAEQLREYLKKDVRVCAAVPKIKMKNVGKYLDSHGKLPKLKHWKSGDKLPYLLSVGDRFLMS